MNRFTMAHLLLFDGVCGLCQGVVQFVLSHDADARFHFAALQSPLAETLLRQHGVEHVEMNTFYLLRDHDGAHPVLLDRSDGALFVLAELGGVLSGAHWLTVFPKSFRDGIYDVVARNRYAWFGERKQCLVPTAENRPRFLDTVQPGV